MLKKLIALLVLIVFILFEVCGVYSYALTPYEGTVENPVLQEVTTDSITLVPIEGYEYSKDGIVWQDSNVFNNLTVATTYEMYQRVKATDEVDKSPKSDMLEVTTKKYENNSIPSIPMLSNRTDTLINLVIFSGYEYSIDGENFQDSSIFTNLMPNTKYTFYQRIKETSDTYASIISNPENIYTLKKNNTTEPEEIQTEEITATSITLVDIEGYEYSIDGTNFQDNNVFGGLAPNTEYTFYQRTKETDEYLAGSISNKTIKTIKYTNNNSVDAPILESYTANDVTLKKLDILEYSKDQENWQDSSIFNDLTPETEYIFYQRIKETDDTYASNSSEGLNIRTKKENTNIPVKPEIENVTENIVTLKAVEGYEYSINQGTTWQESNVFTKLEPLTEYTFVQRIKTDNIFGYSVISEMSEIARTAQILTITNLPDDYIPIYTVEEIPKGVGTSYTTDEYQKALEELRKKYILMNDIEYVNPSNETFSLISLPLEGVIDGNGYSLLNFNRSLVDLNNGIIKNLCIDYGINGEYSNRYYGLVGTNNGKIINCHTRGELIVGNGNGVAGIAWENNGIIKYCDNEAILRQNIGTYSNGYVSGICHVNKGTIEACANKGELINNNSGTIAGISIQNFGIIENCYNNAKMGPGGRAAGIVEENFENGIIKSCYNVGDIFLEETGINALYGYSEVTYASGLCDNNRGIIDCCYNAGNITSVLSFGLVLQNQNKLSNCYNQGKITSLYDNEGGYCTGGIFYNHGTIDNCYNIGVIINTHEFANSANIANSNSGSISCCYYLKNDSSNDNYGEGLSFTEMQQQEFFEGFDFDTIWQIDPNVDYYFPTLRGVENKTILPKNVEIETITINSITIKSIEGYEYSIDGENYQNSNVFEGLTSSTEYTIYQRIKKTETTEESISAYTSVKTLTYIGDINGDGKVNITDVALINAHVKKTKLLAGEELEKADINGDGKVNITDVALVNAHVKKVKLLF